MFRDSLPPSKDILAILVRHGHTALNEMKPTRLRAWENVPLTSRGILDAQLAGQKIQKYQPKIIYASDLDRDTQTAQIISDHNGRIPMEIDFGQRTANLGVLSGMIEYEAADAVLRWYQSPWDPAPSGESFNDWVRRFWGSYEPKLELARESEAFRPSVFVNHGRPISYLHSYYSGIRPEDALMPLPGGVAIVRSNLDGMDSLEFLTPTEPVCIDR